MFHLRAQVAEARECTRKAQALAAGISRRERQQVEAIALFVTGQGPRSYALIREHLVDYPRDMLMLRWRNAWVCWAAAALGRQLAPPLALMQGAASAYGDDWAFLGQYASRTTKQETWRRRRLAGAPALRPTNAVAAHSVPMCLRDWRHRKRRGVSGDLAQGL